MGADNLKIQNNTPPVSFRDERIPVQKTRGQKTFDPRLDENFDRRDSFTTEKDDVKSDKKSPENPVGDEEWLHKRTVEELKTVVQAVQLGVTDPWQLTDLIFYARHPELKGVPMTAEKQDLLDEWNSVSALLVHPTLNEIKDILGAENLNNLVNDKQNLAEAFKKAGNFAINAGNLDNYTTRYDDVIAHAVENCPGLSPAILKSLLAQESKFNPAVINSYGFAGIAQFGRTAAREVGLYVGVAGSAGDERLNPAKAIPGAARLLNIKSERLGEIAFSRYGQPTGIEFWKFVTAAYNGGEGTIALAMGNAYRIGISQARAQGLVGTEAVSFARKYASNWENLKVGGMDSPLGLATARFFPTIAEAKYREIGNYPTQIVARVAGKTA